MISEKRLKGTIDQIQGYIDFTQGILEEEKQLIMLEFDEYNAWTEGINHFCTSLDKLITKIAPH